MRNYQLYLHIPKLSLCEDSRHDIPSQLSVPLRTIISERQTVALARKMTDVLKNGKNEF